MAVKAGVEFIKAVARKLATPRGKGITTIANRMDAEAKAGEIVAILQEAGIPINRLDEFIKSEKDVLKYLNIIESSKPIAREVAPVIPQKKINYTEMEKKLGVKLKGTETWDELKAIEKELTEPKFTKAEDNAWKYTQALWRQEREKKLKPFYKMFGAETKGHKSLIEDFVEETGDTMFIKKAKPKYLWSEIKTNIGDDLAEMGVDEDIALNLGYDDLAKSLKKPMIQKDI